ncbi:MAG TPA: hypothetical protein VEY08_12320 [Chloroflexia bacterium]|nr:hypothetical protein [Chloroflexia bacterium]
MSFIEDAVIKTLDRMEPAERHNLILTVVQHMVSGMPSTERLGLMEHVVDHFLDGLSAEERQATVRELVPRLLAQLMRSGNMNVDELLWAAMGSLGALEASAGSSTGGPHGGANTNTPPPSSRDAVSE